MDDQSSSQSFPNHHHRHDSFFHISLPSLPSPKLGYASPQPAVDPLEQYGTREKDFTTSFLTSSTSPDVRRASNGCERGLLSPNVDGSGTLEDHLDQDGGMGGHFANSWYGAGKKEEEACEDGKSFASAGDNFYCDKNCYGTVSDVFQDNNDGIRRKAKAVNNIYSQCSFEAKSEPAYDREASRSFDRAVAGSFSDSSLDYCRTDSRVSDNYLGREEDYGSSCGSGEDQFQPAEAEAPWLNGSPSSQTGEGRWKGMADTLTLASGCLPQRSPLGVGCGSYPQKLDSFSDAFFPQRKRRFPVISSGDSSGQSWEFGQGRAESPGSAKSRHSCAFDSDSYLPPISSSSPAHPSLASFPSPPTPSHLMSSVLSPPPTPRPPPSYSPSKMDSPGAFRAAGHSVVQGGEAIGALQFFAPHLQPLPSIHASGMIWKLPLLAHNFPQPSANLSNIKSNLRPSYVGEHAAVTASQNILRSTEPPFLTTLLPPSSHCPPNAPSLNASVHLPSLPTQHFEAAEKMSPYMVIQRGQNGSADLKQLQLEHQSSQTYTGTLFPSILHSSRGQKRSHYTPRPLLNPVRRGKGLYSSLQPLRHTEVEAAGGEEEDEDGLFPCVNVGPDFQAELPECFVKGKGPEVFPAEEDSPCEQLLWKPWDELKESTSLQEKVEKLLSMCSSSCLPGGGSNTELALHCLHFCQGNTMATLEKLLFSLPLPTGDYHYSGSDFWTDAEKSLFSAALETYGKEFSLIQKMVRTKTVPQCVEFYYLNKKLHDKQEKQKEEENRHCDLEQQTNTTPTCQPVNRPFALEEVVPVAPLASFFPCKLCGKMFYKIKSRNAHMKIHRQPQEDWTDRRLQHQLLTHRLGSNVLPPQAPARSLPSPCLLGMATNSSITDTVLNSLTSGNNITSNSANVLDPGSLVAFNNGAATKAQAMTDTAGGHSNQRQPAPVLPFRQSWGSLGQGPDPVALFCNTEGKDNMGTVGAKEPINW